MAKLAPGSIQFTGSLGDFSAVPRKDLNCIILRQKGGPSKEKFLKDPVMAGSRRSSAEFTARTASIKYIKTILDPFSNAKNINIQSRFQKLLTPIQKMDTITTWAPRSINLGLGQELLEGLALNNRNSFENIISAPVNFKVERNQLMASIELPFLSPGINFHPIGTFPYCRWIISMGIVPVISAKGEAFSPPAGFIKQLPEIYIGDWKAVQLPQEARTVTLAMPGAPGTDQFSIMLAVGMVFGLPKYNDIVEVKYAGCGKLVYVK